MGTINVKRIYEPADKGDGTRILVDRLWPRGMKKETARLDEWLKEIAPSTELRQWFNHEAPKWKDFHSKYIAELNHNNAAVDQLLSLVKANPTVTVLYAANNEEHNHALVLKEYIDHKLIL